MAETDKTKRFNLWLPAGLYKRLERLVQKRSKELEITVRPTDEIKRAIERHVEAAEGKR